VYFVLFTKKDCHHCVEALDVLMRGHRSYVLHETDDLDRLDELKEEHEWPTFPIVYISNGQRRRLIGGCAELKQFLAKDMVQKGIGFSE
tara:strand:- start:1477 stop:1743 length:267 start_codon:yes stop_codon:yes gene_type:complete